jgi:hypothetical protein
MTYNLLTGLHVGDAVRISNAVTKVSDLFKVVAIERDVDKFGTPLPTLGHQRTIRGVAHTGREGEGELRELDLVHPMSARSASVMSARGPKQANPIRCEV